MFDGQMRADNHMDFTQMECNTCAEHQLLTTEYIYITCQTLTEAAKLPRPSHHTFCIIRMVDRKLPTQVPGSVQSTPRLWQLHINQSRYEADS